jgi:hypothetical protein
MSVHKKRLAIVGSVAVTAVVAAGAAWAAFGSGVEGTASGSAESVQIVTVAGTQVKKTLLPGEASPVKLKITNPNENVRAQILGVAPAGVVVAGTATAAQNTACAEHLFQDATLATPGTFPTLDKDAHTTVTLPNGISLGNAPLECNGMTYTTTWKVDFQAVR